MAVEIPLRFEKAESTVPVRLDGTNYRLQVQWNTRFSFWSLAILSSDGTTLLGHQRITLRVDMLRSHVGSNIPPGALVVVDTTGRDVEPGRDDLDNGRVRLVYLTAQEVADAA